MRVSVVVCAYTEERWHDLEAAMHSLQAQTALPHEVIVVVDHHPALLARLQNSGQGVIAIPNAGPRGLSSARNSGIIAASGDIVAFLDDDACAAPNWLATLAAGYENPEVIGIGGMIEPRWAGRTPQWFPPEFLWTVGCTYVGMPVTAARVRNLIGANMSFRREIFARLSGFDARFGHIGPGLAGDEETDLCIRISQQWPRHVLWYEPGAVVSHHVPRARARWRHFRARCFAEGRSKAMLATRVGADDALSSERAYTLRTLPCGVARGIADTILRGDLAGLLRACAIIAGFVITMTGFVVGTLTIGFSRDVPARRAPLPEPEMLPIVAGVAETRTAKT